MLYTKNPVSNLPSLPPLSIPGNYSASLNVFSLDPTCKVKYHTNIILDICNVISYITNIIQYLFSVWLFLAKCPQVSFKLLQTEGCPSFSLNNIPYYYVSMYWYICISPLCISPLYLCVSLFLMELSLTQWLDIEITSLKYKGWRWLTAVKNELGIF